MTGTARVVDISGDESKQEANANLTQTRDLLFPGLISGKRSVEDLDIQCPPSMREE